jgi:hypothetical protein
MASRLIQGVLYGLLATTFAHADSLTYRNDRFGTTITFPAELFDVRGALPANGDGMTWTGPGGIALAVYGSFNTLELPPSEYLSWSVDTRETSAEITYTRTGKDWVVISGLENETVFYERYVFDDDIIHAMRLSYPEHSKAELDPLVGPIANSLSAP